MEEEKNIKYGHADEAKIVFNTKNVSIIGANGSGKSSLLRKFKQFDRTRFTIITAHKNLTIRQGLYKGNEDNWLTQHSSRFMSPVNGEMEVPNDNNNLQEDFNQIIEILFREYNDASVEALNSHKTLEETDRKLDKIIDVWNSIFIDKKLLYKDKKIKVQVIDESVDGQEVDNQSYYEIENLSDGERCALYILIKTLLSDDNSTIIIDEPETYLNPAILNNLFDECEKIKINSSFVYFSHDLEFVTTRKDNTIFWIKSFTFPDKWVIESLNSGDIPEELIVKVIGAKKQKILFVESEKNKDSQLYQLLYPDFKVWPVSGCENVIHYTKAFNSRTEKFNKEYFGLIDRDLKSEEHVRSLEEERIFCLPLALYENLFLDKGLIKFVFDYLGRSDFDLKFSELEEKVRSMLDDENFKLDYKKTKIQDLFNTNIDNISKGNMQLMPDFNKYAEEISQFNSKEYYEILKIFNQKCLKSCISKLGFSWSEWQSQVINIFNTDKAENLREQFFKTMPVIIAK